MTQEWRNWAGTVVCTPKAVTTARTVEEVSLILATANAAKTTVRPVGSGHSFSPLVGTDGIILDLSPLSGVLEVDREKNIVRVGAGSTIGSLGEPLWEAGFSLLNQGAIDVQTIAGATGTSTHGSGLAFQAMSGAIEGVELVTASGEVLDIGSDDPMLPAVRASMGTLGVITRIDLRVQPAYKIRETITYLPLGEVMERWDEQCRTRRHFGFVWGPDYEMSAELPEPPSGMPDRCLVRTFDELPADAEDRNVPGGNVGRAYRIFPDVYEPPWEEVEYFVPFEATAEVLAAITPIVEKYPDDWPVEFRAIAGDESWLSPMYGRDSTAVGFNRTFGRDNRDFFAEIDAAMVPFAGRPHWGKQPRFLERDRLRELYPRFDDFVDLRRRLDPEGTLLNRELAAVLS